MNKAVKDYIVVCKFFACTEFFGLDTCIVYSNRRQPGIWDNWRMPEKLVN